MLIFTTPTSLPPAQALAKKLQLHLHICVPTIFSDGNSFIRLPADPRDHNCLIVQTLYGDSLHLDIINTLFIADSLRRSHARKIILIIPFFSYAKADQANGPGTSQRAQVVASLFSPKLFDQLVTLDLHRTQVNDFFPGNATHLVSDDFWCQWLRENMPTQDLTLVAPDQGAAAKVQSLANKLHLPRLIARKSRPDFVGAPQVSLTRPETLTSRALIIDDFTTSGQTLVATAKILKAQGFSQVEALVTHAPLCPDAYQTLQENHVLERLYTTNTTRVATSDTIRVINISEWWEKWIRQEKIALTQIGSCDIK